MIYTNDRTSMSSVHIAASTVCEFVQSNPLLSVAYATLATGWLIYKTGWVTVGTNAWYDARHKRTRWSFRLEVARPNQ